MNIYHISAKPILAFLYVLIHQDIQEYRYLGHLLMCTPSHPKGSEDKDTC